MAKSKLKFKRKHISISAKEKKAVEDRIRPNSLVIYETISQQGRSELERPIMSLWFSGVTAGFAISLSVLAKSFFYDIIPEGTASRELWAHLGYSFGFIVVILGRMQLFTENTITPVLPFLISFNFNNLKRIARLWSIVFLANVFGTLIIALAIVFVGILTSNQIDAVLKVSEELTHLTFLDALVRSMPAGFLIASIVWLMPAIAGSEVIIILGLTFLMSLGAFPHIIVGSIEALVLILSNKAGILEMITNFYIPVCLGNIIGGTGLFALLSYGQIHQEI